MCMPSRDDGSRPRRRANVSLESVELRTTPGDDCASNSEELRTTPGTMIAMHIVVAEFAYLCLDLLIHIYSFIFIYFLFCVFSVHAKRFLVVQPGGARHIRRCALTNARRRPWSDSAGGAAEARGRPWRERAERSGLAISAMDWGRTENESMQSWSDGWKFVRFRVPTQTHKNL